MELTAPLTKSSLKQVTTVCASFHLQNMDITRLLQEASCESHEIRDAKARRA